MIFMADEDIGPGKLNPWLKDKLEKGEQVEATRNDVPLPFILEIDQQKVEGVLEELSPIAPRVSEKIDIPDTPLMFIPAAFPRTVLKKITEIDGLKQVHYDMPVQILQNGMPFEVLNFEKPTIRDPLLGKIEMTPISQQRPLSPIPQFYSRLGLPPQPLIDANMFIANNPAPIPPTHSPQVDQVVPTSVVKEKVGIPDDNEVKDTKVGVLDTGAIDVNHPQWKKEANIKSTTGEAATDLQGHGSWCSTCAFGGVSETRFGRVEGMADVVGENVYLGKVLTNIGFGMTRMILRGMEWMLKSGVDLVSMSLGGSLQGSVKEDPQIKVIQKTSDKMDYVIAAGNSGPDSFSLGSPGCAPDALTVAAYSTVNDDVSDFSSRGPQGEFYKDKPELFERDKEKYGENFLKPTLGGYGGGPSGDNPRDDLLSGSQGKSDSPPTGHAYMRGTSMATPQVAGLVALAREKGLIDGVQDVKDKMAEKADGKDEARGYGLLNWEDLK